MPQINNLGLQTPAPGPVDYAQARPNTAFAQAGKEAGAIATQLDQYADQDAAVDGLKRLTDFDIASQKRLQELQQQAKTPDGFGDAWASDWQQRADALITATNNPRTARFLGERLAIAQGPAVKTGLAWEAGQKEALQATQFNESMGQIASSITSDPARFPEALSNLDAMLKDGNFEPAKREALWLAGSRQYAQSYVSGRGMVDPQGALTELQDGKLDKYIDPDNKIVLMNHLEARLRERDAGASQDAIDLAQSSVKSVMETGKPLTAEQEQVIQAGLSPRQYARYRSQVDKAQQVYTATGDMATLAPGQMIARVEALKPQGGEADYSDKEAAYIAALTRMHEVMNARRTNPGLAVRNSFPEVQQAWQQYEAAGSGDKAKTLQAALKATQAAEASVGVPIVQQKLMADEMAQGIAGQIRGAPPEQAAQILRATAEQFGSYWPKALRQMSPLLDPASKVAATIDDSAAAALLLETSRQPLEATIKATGAKTSEIYTQVIGDPRIKALQFSLSQRQGGAQTATDVLQAVQIMALGRMRTFSEDQTTATDKAIESIVGKKYDFGGAGGGKSFRVPKGFDVSNIEDAAFDAKRNLAGDGLDLPGALPGALSQDTRDSYLSAVRRNGYWVTNDDESGLILYNERGVPVTRGGKPIEFKFDQLQSTPPPSGIQQGQPLGGVGGPYIPEGGAAVTPTGERVTTSKTRDPAVAASRARLAGYPEWAVKDQGFLFAFETGKQDEWMKQSSPPDADVRYLSEGQSDRRDRTRAIEAHRDAYNLAHQSPQQGFTPTELMAGEDLGGSYGQDGQPVVLARGATKGGPIVVGAYPTPLSNKEIYRPTSPHINWAEAPDWLKDIERWRKAKVLEAETNHDPKFVQTMAEKVRVEVEKAKGETADRKRIANQYLAYFGWMLHTAHDKDLPY